MAAPTPEERKALIGLEYSDKQIDLMTVATMQRVLRERQPNRGISISRGGELRFVGHPPPGPPLPRRRPPPPPPKKR